MVRLKEELARDLALRVEPDDGDLVLRIRRPRLDQGGWEVLIRLSARPLSVRPWRICDRKGALNAAVAHAMVLLTNPQPGDSFLNIACGSGTLAIERLNQGPAIRVLGCDIDPEALQCARLNRTASGYGEQIELYEWDARALPIPDKSVDVLCADLPFGHVIGSHEENVNLYPALLQEGARVAKPGARACLLTHDVKLMESVIHGSQDWRLQDVITISVGGLHPRIYLLARQ
jgi:23S rRNA G2445 N2-methylase RlmL